MSPLAAFHSMCPIKYLEAVKRQWEVKETALKRQWKVKEKAVEEAVEGQEMQWMVNERQWKVKGKAVDGQ